MSHEAANLIPARMVNEYAYCPRLFYLEYVQQEWAHSADTLDGRFTHRRVDQATGAVPAAQDVAQDGQIHARSVWLSAANLGATARLDLLEGTGQRVTPVDYKRGARPAIPEGAYEPERVQVCLQGLILRENGYQCDAGIIYFAASQDRVRVPLTPELITRTLLLLAEARQLARTNQIPPPLVASPKCPRCSLVGICLPDEVNFLQLQRSGRSDANADESQPAADTTTVLAVGAPAVSNASRAVSFSGATGPQTAKIRKLLPALDDRLPVYVQGQGFSLGLKGEVLEVRDKTKVVSTARLLTTSQVNLFGNVQLSAQALRELAAREIPILHLSYGGWLSAVTTPPPHKNIHLRQRQFLAAQDPQLCTSLAGAFTAGKIHNSRILLRRNARPVSVPVLARLAHWRQRARLIGARNNEPESALGSLLGIEGNAARDYFGVFATMFKPTAGASAPAFDFSGRNRRPPRDPVNALLSFCYALLLKELVVAAIGVGFDPYQGFYHQAKYGKPALALDLMEEFRPLVADSVVISVINNGEIKPSDFITRAGAVALTESGRRAVMGAFERRLSTEVTHPIFGYAASYRRIFELQTRLLARYLMGEIKRYPPFCTR